MFGELIFIVLSFLAFFTWVKVRENKRTQEAVSKNLNVLPGPISLPIIGSTIQGLCFLELKSSSELYYQQLHRMCTRYGKTMGIQIGCQYYAITEDFEVAKEMLNSPAFSPRFPSRPIFREHTYGKNLGLMWSSGESWKEMRRFTSRTLKNFGFGELKSAEVFLEEELDYFLKALDKDRTLNNNEVFMRKYFKIPTFNILWRVMAGVRLMYEDEEMKRIINLVEDVAEIEVGNDPEIGFPILRKIPGLSKSEKKKESFDGCHEFFEEIMRKRRETGAFREKQNDYMDYFLLKVEEEKNNPDTLYTDEQFVTTCADLLFGGVDTTANSLEFAILYMVKFPHVQQKVRAEIFSIVGKHRNPSYTDRSNMVYTEATMLEILRHANIVPINGRTSLYDTSIKGFFIPEGTLFGMNTTIIHMSEEIWGDPQNFRPERFLDADNKIINEDKIFAFGGGKRLCLGYTMAKVIWLSFFTRLIQRYNFEISPTHPELSTIPKCGVANTAQPFYTIVKLID